MTTTPRPRPRGALASALLAATLVGVVALAGAPTRGSAQPAPQPGAAPPPAADDRAACAEGIAAIQAALGRNPSSADRGRLERALRVARREQGEREYDECVEAIAEVRGLLGAR